MIGHPWRPGADTAVAFEPETTGHADRPDLRVSSDDRQEPAGRAERRVGARLSRAQDVVDCVAVPRQIPVDSRPGCIFMRRPDVGNSLFCRVDRGVLGSCAYRMIGQPS